MVLFQIEAFWVTLWFRKMGFRNLRFGEMGLNHLYILFWLSAVCRRQCWIPVLKGLKTLYFTFNIPATNQITRCDSVMI